MPRLAQGRFVGAVLMIKETRMATFIKTALAASMTTLALAQGAQAADTYVYGRYFNDGLDSRQGAYEFGKATERAGYGLFGSLEGATASDAWVGGLNAAILADFGHGNAGLFQTDEGATDAEDEIVAAGSRTEPFTPEHFAYWKEYFPYTDVDKMRLAIIATCDSANTDVRFGSLPDMGRELGIDSVVGFGELVFYPANCYGSAFGCDYSGNYFWKRAGSYLEGGDTVRDALSKATADLVTLEGDPQGWQNWYARGGVDDAGAVTITPADYGEEYNSHPLGVEAFDPTELIDIDQSSSTVDGRTVIDHSTQQGVSYRTDAAGGDLLWLSAPAALSGPVMMTTDEARAAAVKFVEDNVKWFSPASMDLQEQTNAHHAAGDALSRFVWRTPEGSAANPAYVLVEVDRKTGAVVTFMAARKPPLPGPATVTRDVAIAAARAVAGAVGQVTRADYQPWDRKRWVITIDRGTRGLFRDVIRVVVDATTGTVVSQAKT
jgi:hypothetical protein